MNRLLKMAVVAGSNKAVSLHLEKKPDLNVVDEKGMSLLMLAASRGHLETCCILLEAGADPHFENEKGQTAINVAIGKGHLDIASTIDSYVSAAGRNQVETGSSVMLTADDDFLDIWDEEVQDEVPEPGTVHFISDDAANLENVPLSCLDTLHLGPLSLVAALGGRETTAGETGPPSTSDAIPSEPQYDYGDSASLEDWTQDPEPVIPVGDHAIFSSAQDVQARFSSHRAADLDLQWNDIEIELPEFTWCHAGNYLRHHYLDIERKLFVHGIKCGRIVSGQLDKMAELADDADGYAEGLLLVLNDLGIRIDGMSCDYIDPSALEEPDAEFDEAEILLAEEAIRFLWEKNNPAHDPDWLFLQDLRRFPMLTAEEEISLGRMAFEGRQSAIEAAALLPPAVAELLEIIRSKGISKVVATSGTDSEGEQGGQRLESVFDDSLYGRRESDCYIGESLGEEEQQSQLSDVFATVTRLYEEAIQAADAGFTEECTRKLHLIRAELVGISFTSEVVLRVADAVSTYWETLQNTVEQIRKICTKYGGMDSVDFQGSFLISETNVDWGSAVTANLRVEIVSYRTDLVERQKMLRDLERTVRIPLQEFMGLYSTLDSGARKLRNAHYRMTISNLRLAHHIATKYQGSGLPLPDLVQEANIGLMKAVDRFDYRRGFRFSTIATWWIRQSVTRGIADKLRSIRIPVHMLDSLAKVRQAARKLEAVGQEPSPERIAPIVLMAPDRVRKVLDLSDETLSLEALEEEFPGFVEKITDEKQPEAEIEALDEQICSETIDRVLSTLPAKEEKVIRMRFGLGEARSYTLEEIGTCFELTRERIRQIEKKALRQLKHPSRSAHLEAFIL